MQNNGWIRENVNGNNFLRWALFCNTVIKIEWNGRGNAVKYAVNFYERKEERRRERKKREKCVRHGRPRTFHSEILMIESRNV